MNKLSKKDYVTLSTMLFGFFFGAGNLIFPVFLGQQAGSHTLSAVMGFIATSVGFSFLGIIGLAITKSNNAIDIMSPLGKPTAYFFNSILLLLCGPLLIIPRLASTSFELGIMPFVSDSHYQIAKVIFTIIFFAIVFVLSLKPGKIMDYVGKILTPAFLVLLLTLIIVALVTASWHINSFNPLGSYRSAPFLSGFLEGYNTMDACASLLFGSLMVVSLKELGIVSPKKLAIETVKAGFFAMLLMAIIYVLLALVGVNSLHYLANASNGGIILVATAKHLFGTLGLVLLMLIVILACLKTAIGLSAADGEGFNDMFPKISYLKFMIIGNVIGFALALYDLNQIMQIMSPLLMGIYPIILVLIILSVFDYLIKQNQLIYRVTILFTFIPAIGCGLWQLPKDMQNQAMIHSFLSVIDRLPLASLGMPWVVPAFVGFVLSSLAAYGLSKKA